MLLACLQRQDITPPAVSIHGLPHYPPRKFTHVFFPAAQKTEIRPAEIQRDSERLSVTAGNVGTPLPGRLYDSQGGRVGLYCEESLDRMDRLRKAVQVLDDAVAVYPGNQDSGDIP